MDKLNHNIENETLDIEKSDSPSEVFRSRAVAGVLAFWVAALLMMALSRELVFFQKNTCKFIAIPVDPRDLFRGDYVILSTNLRNVNTQHLANGRYFYVRLINDRNGHATPLDNDAVLSKPKQGQFIRGQMGKTGPIYGIEKYFVPEGKGRIIERKLINGEISIEVALDRNTGEATIKNLLLHDSPIDFNQI